MKVTGNIIDVLRRQIFYGALIIEDGIIRKREVLSEQTKQDALWLLPGFVDAHVHVESSMLVPSEFARLAVVHGTVATVSDPHEIANVLGTEGVDFMIENGRQVPFKFYFGAPSCVPATTFETAGAVVDANDIRQLLARDEIVYLAEMMNYPGVLFDDPVVWDKIRAARLAGKPIDGHAPGLVGEAAIRYINAGITTDHECVTYEEALHKLQHGMKISIREGSAAKNFEALHPLISEYPGHVMLCSDDKHPDDLIEGHINQLAARAASKGHALMNVLQVACVNPVRHYGLKVGLLQPGDPADFIAVHDIERFEVAHTWISGELVMEQGKTLIRHVDTTQPNHFQTSHKSPEQFSLPGTHGRCRVIRAIDGALITEQDVAELKVRNGEVQTDIEKDVLKLAVVNRYSDAPPAVALIRGFGLREGAIGSCVGHDSHNIIAVGVDDASLCAVVNQIIDQKGGIAVRSELEELGMPLPVAGIMSAADGYEVGRQYAAMDRLAKEKLGTRLRAPFMTLSFMALLVIPSLKLSDKGLFDGDAFEFVSLELDA